ncbi:MAG TPA: NAD(P)H-binding protein [Oculatellaceae cyanobacterium]
MFAILGATGKVGGSTIAALRASGMPVRAVIRDLANAAPLIAAGCEIAVANIEDPISVANAMRDASAVQVILPTAPSAENAGGVMSSMIASLVEALQVARPPMILAISDYGAERKEGTGITLLFHELETQLCQLSARLIFLRSAEHMENILRVFQAAAKTGYLPSMHHPLTKIFPTVSARDVGQVAAELLQSSLAQNSSPLVVHAEGPRRYSVLDFEQAMSVVLARTICAQELPRADWKKALCRGGISPSYADLVVELYEAHNAGRIDAQVEAGEIYRGRTEFAEVLNKMVAASNEHPANV